MNLIQIRCKTRVYNSHCEIEKIGGIYQGRKILIISVSAFCYSSTKIIRNISTQVDTPYLVRNQLHLTFRAHNSAGEFLVYTQAVASSNLAVPMKLFSVVWYKYYATPYYTIQLPVKC